MKRIHKAALVLAFGLGLAQAAHAISSTDSIVVTITPNAYYAIAIDTANVALDLGTVNLAGSTQTVRPSTVTIESTFATTDVRLQGGITAPGGTAWTFDDNTATTGELNKLAAWATFTSIARSSVPSQTADYFFGTVPGNDNSDVIDTTSRYVGTSATTNDLFENASGFDLQQMDNLPPFATSPTGSKSHLWLYFRLPGATTSSVAQKITITLFAVAPN